ncbi:MAG: type I-C CRISPR-associated protein Cas5c [Oscillospiraceae bacterium]|nr:type I-C CRISPR-associated protein Cas5c [Oscillospiraceae bacterium]
MSYGFKVSIKGDYACFSRPELKVERVSYEVITPSAARGIMESILWKPAIRYIIDRIDVCAPIRFENIRRNEVNSKVTNMSLKNAQEKLQKIGLYLDASADRAQRASMVLRDVHYVVYGHFEMTNKAGATDNEGKFTEMLRRRLEKGQHYHMPYLGTREFPAQIQLITEGEMAPVPIEESRSLGLMLYDINFIKTIDKKDGREIVTAFEPTYFMAEMCGGTIDLRGVEVLR